MSIVYDTIYFKRGPEATMPNIANNGEPLWTTDTHRMFVGYGNGIKEIATADMNGFVTPEQFGGKGDWNGFEGTDNLIPLQDAAASIAITGGTIVLSRGDYWISNSWNIKQSNIYVRIDPGSTLRTNVETSYGHTIAFLGTAPVYTEDEPPVLVSAEVIYENVGIYGGGNVCNVTPYIIVDPENPPPTDNAIGFSRVKNYSCIGMVVPYCSRKAITAQINCDYGKVINNRVISSNERPYTFDTTTLQRANQGAIAIEFGRHSSTTGCEYTIVEGNIVEDAGYACGFTFQKVYYSYADEEGNTEGVTYDTGNPVTSQNMIRAAIRNNTVIKSALHGFHFDGLQDFASSGNMAISATGHGFYFQECSNFTSTGDQTLVPTQHGMLLDKCSGGVSVLCPIINNPSQEAPGNGYDAIYLKNPISKHNIVGMYETGSKTRYAVNGIGIVAATTPNIVGPSINKTINIAYRDVYAPTQAGTAAANTITPRYIGDEYLLTSGPTFYKAKGLTTSDWIALN